MNEKQHVARNAGFALAGEVVQHVLILLVGIFVPRYLGRHDYGIYAFVTSSVGLLLVFTDLGISTMVVREISRDRSSVGRIMPQVFGLKLTIGFILMFSVWGAGYLGWIEGESATAIRIMAFLLVLGPLSSYEILFRATERMEFQALAQIINRSSILAFLAIVVFLDAGLNGVIITHLSGALIMFAVIYIIVARNYEPMKIGFNIGEWRSIIARALPFMAMSILWGIFLRIDQILIPYLDSFESNGLFRVAAGITLMTLIFPVAINSAIYPYFVRKSNESNEPLRKGTIEIYRILGIMGLGTAVFIGFPAADWLVLIWGEKFRTAAPALAILMIGTPFAFLHGVHIATLYSYNRQNVVLWFSFICIGMDVILDLLLIPVLGISGAAVATVATHILFFILTFSVANRELGGIPIVRTVSGPIFCALSAAVCLYIGREWLFSVRMAAAGSIFIVLVVVTRTLVLEDLKLFTDLISRRHKY